jgi:catechol 2,3-dioxygenase-like lactoylglutathione lyase family enzyme
MQPPIIKLESPILFVRDIQASRRFYEGLLGQKVQMDFGVNVGFEGGLAIWQTDHVLPLVFGRPARPDSGGDPRFELYFETVDLDAAWDRLMSAGVTAVHAPREQPYGQRVARVLDPDGHLIEIAEPMPVVVKRLLAQGLTVEAVVQRTGMPAGVVHEMAAV